MATIPHFVPPRVFYFGRKGVLDFRWAVVVEAAEEPSTARAQSATSFRSATREKTAGGPQDGKGGGEDEP